MDEIARIREPIADCFVRSFLENETARYWEYVTVTFCGLFDRIPVRLNGQSTGFSNGKRYYWELCFRLRMHVIGVSREVKNSVIVFHLERYIVFSLHRNRYVSVKAEIDLPNFLQL